MEKIRIILADDMEIMNTLRIKHLSTLDYVDIVGVAKNGKEEFELIKELQPDVVITDNQMPMMNGIDVINKVAEDNTIQNKPKFVIISGDNLYEFLREGTEKNVICALQKMIGDEEINFRLEEILFEVKEMMKK